MSCDGPAAMSVRTAQRARPGFLYSVDPCESAPRAGALRYHLLIGCNTPLLLCAVLTYLFD